MRILHTSDWHIGATLYGRKRYDETQKFLAWLIELIRDEAIDALLVPGDIFDTSTPSYQAQALYYGFLSDVSRKTSCRQVVITSGNHDSPTFLDAPKPLLNALNVSVVGSISQPQDELVELKDAAGVTQALVCAVPFLRERDVRFSEEGESGDDKQDNLIRGIVDHYRAVYDEAIKLKQKLGCSVPIIGMGHLFLAGTTIYKREGAQAAERDLYVGNLGQVPAERLPSFDYFALGHLHIAQSVAKNEVIRYSGAPLVMNFDEINRKCCVYAVDIASGQALVKTIEVPTFRQFRRIRGDWQTIESTLQTLKTESFEGWVEVVYEGQETISDLRERVAAIVENTRIDVLKIQNTMIYNAIIREFEKEEALEDLSVKEVFRRRLKEAEKTELESAQLETLFDEIVENLQSEEPNGR